MKQRSDSIKKKIKSEWRPRVVSVMEQPRHPSQEHPARWQLHLIWGQQEQLCEEKTGGRWRRYLPHATLTIVSLANTVNNNNNKSNNTIKYNKTNNSNSKNSSNSNTKKNNSNNQTKTTVPTTKTPTKNEKKNRQQIKKRAPQSHRKSVRLQGGGEPRESIPRQKNKGLISEWPPPWRETSHGLRVSPGLTSC